MIITLYAFPRSGGTLLSTILMNHPDVFVTSEFHEGKKMLPSTNLQYSWDSNIQHLNTKFELELNPGDSFAQIDHILQKQLKNLVYRVWVPGYVDEFGTVDQIIGPQKNIILLRNFFHAALSAYDDRKNITGIRRAMYITIFHLKSLLLRKKTPDKDLFYWFEMYKKYLEHIVSIRNKLIVHYEDLVKDPRREVGRIFDYLQLDTSHISHCLIINVNSNLLQAAVISGDQRAKKSTSVRQSTKYPRWRVSDSSYKAIIAYLKQYPVLKYLGLNDN